MNSITAASTASTDVGRENRGHSPPVRIIAEEMAAVLSGLMIEEPLPAPFLPE
jgi:hypothetical protein